MTDPLIHSRELWLEFDDEYRYIDDTIGVTLVECYFTNQHRSKFRGVPFTALNTPGFEPFFAVEFYHRGGRRVIIVSGNMRRYIRAVGTPDEYTTINYSTKKGLSNVDGNLIVSAITAYLQT